METTKREYHRMYMRNRRASDPEFAERYREYSRRYIRNKRATDPEYVQMQLELCRKRQQEKYANDPEWVEHHREVVRKRLQTPEGKVYNRVSAYNQAHPGQEIETPLEAKRKYLESGYVPTYIKHDDL